MHERVCCFTGHHKKPGKGYSDDIFIARLVYTITALIEEGVTHFKSGGAAGFDVLAALTILSIREANPDITLEMVLPHKNYVEDGDFMLNHIVDYADKVVYVSDRYYSGCMQRMNRQLVDGSDVCVCYLKESTSGTAYAVRYAKQKEVRIINLA
jgi:uncharacterized phage-like protein YoqJ